MIGIVTAWIVTIWISWTLVFASVEGSVVEATTGETADLWGKAYFAGYSILTLGNGELVPASTPWRLTTLAAAGTGLALVTLAVTYILNVVQASNRRRSLAAVIWTLGDTSADIVERAANDPDNFSSQVWSLVEPFTLSEGATCRISRPSLSSCDRAPPGAPRPSRQARPRCPLPSSRSAGRSHFFVEDGVDRTGPRRVRGSGERL